MINLMVDFTPIKIKIYGTTYVKMRWQVVKISYLYFLHLQQPF